MAFPKPSPRKLVGLQPLEEIDTFSFSFVSERDVGSVSQIMVCALNFKDWSNTAVLFGARGRRKFDAMCDFPRPW